MIKALALVLGCAVSGQVQGIGEQQSGHVFFMHTDPVPFDRSSGEIGLADDAIRLENCLVLDGGEEENSSRPTGCAQITSGDRFSSRLDWSPPNVTGGNVAHSERRALAHGVFEKRMRRHSLITASKGNVPSSYFDISSRRLAGIVQLHTDPYPPISGNCAPNPHSGKICSGLRLSNFASDLDSVVSGLGSAPGLANSGAGSLERKPEQGNPYYCGYRHRPLCEGVTQDPMPWYGVVLILLVLALPTLGAAIGAREGRGDVWFWGWLLAGVAGAACVMIVGANI